MSDVLRKLFKPTWEIFQNFPKCTTTFPLNQLHGLYQQNIGKAHEKMHLFKLKLQACNNSKCQPCHLFLELKLYEHHLMLFYFHIKILICYNFDWNTKQKFWNTRFSYLEFEILGISSKIPRISKTWNSN